jgi:DNA-binding transcriptional regulator YdaS (Cro superfamily)
VDILDKVEYKIRADEIKALIGEGRYAEAVKIADTIDWKRVKSVQMLCTISDLYKINRRYTESKDVLLMAYDRYPTGRAIVYSLCELAIKMGEFVQAVEYYKEFVRIAPRDTGRYILQYKLYEAQEVSLEERIAVLEEYKKHDYRERWAYELAYLYHRVGLTTECIEECDEMFLWFGEGRYVIKALELKALHEPLSPEQQDRYVRYKQNHGGMIDPSIVSEKDEVGKDETRTVEIKQPTKEMPAVTDEVINAYNTGTLPAPEGAIAPQEDLGETREFDRIVYPNISEITEPSVDVSTYNTMNLQESLAESIKELYANEESEDTKVFEPVNTQVIQGQVQPITEEIFEDVTDEEAVIAAGEAPQEEPVQEPVTEVTQETLADFSAESLEDYADQGDADYSEESLDDYQPEPALEAPSLDDILEKELEEKEEELPEEELPEEEPTEEEASVAGMQEVFFETDPKMGIEIKYGGNGPILGEEKVIHPEEPAIMATPVSDLQEEPEEEEEQENPVIQPFKTFSYAQKPLEDEVPGAVIHPNANYQMNNRFESMLSQESDGQLSLAVEPEPAVEKQITGQISIEEYLNNWENYKKQQQQKQFESLKRRVADETGDMFAEFDEKTKAGLQEKLERAINNAIKKESYAKASGRGDWSVKKEDVINAAVDEVMDEETGVHEPELADENPETDDTEYVAEAAADENQAVATDEAAETTQEADSQETDAEAPAGMEELHSEDPADAEEDNAEEEDEAEDSDEDDEESDDEPEESAEKAPEPAPAATPAEKPEPKPAKPATPEKKHHIGNRELEERVRTMTPEEKELFGPYIHHKKSRRQIINAIDNLSMDPYTGNAIVTGEEGAGTVNLAKGLIKAMQASDANFSGKVAKITANTLNKKSTASIFDKLANGALVISRATDLTQETVSELLKILQQENKGLVLVMEDTKEDMDRFLDKNPSLKQSFNVRVDIEALDDDSLVAYARQYALEKEYSIDNLGILALHTRISERQTLDHDVTVSEVKDIVDDAIYYAEKRTVGHFVDVIVHKRYDENDMIILREKDFMHD